MQQALHSTGLPKRNWGYEPAPVQEQQHQAVPTANTRHNADTTSPGSLRGSFSKYPHAFRF